VDILTKKHHQLKYNLKKWKMEVFFLHFMSILTYRQSFYLPPPNSDIAYSYCARIGHLG
jgi:hypothetical protein